MATLHGWINLEFANEETRKTLESMEKTNAIQTKIFGQNGEVSCNFFTCRNHYGPSFENLYQELEKIAVRESGSYGLIYVQDDEHQEFHDIWQVWVIRQGRIERKEDSFLSPLSKKVHIYDTDEEL